MADILYTGKGLTTKLPSDGGQAMGRLSNFIVKAEEIKYNAFRENEKEYLKASNIDPAFFISTANQKAQAKLLDDFNQRWSQRWKETGAKMSTDEKAQMQAEKSFIIGKQQEMQAQEAIWKEHSAMVKQNPMRYNAKKFEENTKRLLEQGEYREVAPPLKSKDFSLFLKEQSNKLNREKIEYTKGVPDAFGRISQQFTNISDEDIPNFIESNFFIDDQATQGVIEDFLADKSPEKMALMEDTNGDGRITNEDADENVIVAWAKQNPKYISAVRRLTTDTRNLKSEKTTKDKGIPTRIGGEEKNIFAGQKRTKPIKYAGKERNNLYAFEGGEVISNIPTDGGLNIDRPTAIALRGGTNISGQLVDYDADANALIIRTTTGIPSLNLDPKSLVQIPIENVIGGENLPIIIDGKQTTVGELAGQETKGTQAKPTFMDWRKIKGNENKTFKEYNEEVHGS